MFRVPERPQRSPGATPPTGRHPSPSSGSGFPGARPPYGNPGHQQQQQQQPFQRSSPYPTGPPVFSPGASRGYRNHSPGGYGSGPQRGFRGSPAGFRGGPRHFGASPGGSRSYVDSPSGYGGGSFRGFSGPNRRRGDGYWRPHSSPSSAPYFKGSSDVPVEKYYRASILQDPWKNLQPVTAAEAKDRRSR